MHRRASEIGGGIFSLIRRRAVPHQISAVMLGLLVGPLAAIPLAMQARLIDEALPAKNLALAIVLALLYGAAVLARSLIKSAIVWLQGVIAEIVARGLRQTLLDTQRRRSGECAREELGTATSVITAEVDALGGFAAEAISTPVLQGAVMAGVVGFMIAAEPALAAVGIAALVTEALLTPLLQRRVNLQTRRRIESLRAISRQTIRAAETGLHRHYVEALRGVRQTFHVNLRMNAIKVAMKLVKHVIDHAADVSVLAIGAWLVIKGETHVGVVVAFLSGLRELREPWGELIGFYRRWADAKTKLELIRQAVEA